MIAVKQHHDDEGSLYVGLHLYSDVNKASTIKAKVKVKAKTERIKLIM